MCNVCAYVHILVVHLNLFHFLNLVWRLYRKHFLPQECGTYLRLRFSKIIVIAIAFRRFFSPASIILVQVHIL